MNDTVIDSYVKKLLGMDLNEKQFYQYIDVFSDFLGYTNPNYKYNGTYLVQYRNDFVKTYKSLCDKKKIYDKIRKEILEKVFEFYTSLELTLDGSYKYSSQKNKTEFVYLDKDKICSQVIEVQAVFEISNERVMFCREYNEKDFENIPNDISEFAKSKVGEGK